MFRKYRNENFIDILISAPCPFFVESIEGKEEPHAAQFIANQIERTFTNYGPEKFASIVMDNASTNKAAAELITSKYPHVSAIGCCCHLLHLLCNDILKLDSAVTVISQAKSIINLVKNKHIVTATFNKLKSNDVKDLSLKLPVPTRWDSYVDSFESMLRHKNTLEKLVIHKYSRKNLADKLEKAVSPI